MKFDIKRDGAPWKIRTPDPQLRRLLLYPAELRARNNRLSFHIQKIITYYHIFLCLSIHKMKKIVIRYRKIKYYVKYRLYMREIALDTETTGLSYKEGDRIVEIGCVEIINKKTTGNEFHVYINPERELSLASENITGLRYEFLKQFDTFDKIVDKFIEFIGNDRLVIHNAEFDTGFLNHELSLCGREPLKNEIIDTLYMAKQKFPGAPATLDALCKRFSIDKTIRTKHGALIDSILLAEVYNIMSVEINQKDIFSMFGNSSIVEQNEYKHSKNIPYRSFSPSNLELKNHLEFIKNKIKNPLWDQFKTTDE